MQPPVILKLGLVVPDTSFIEGNRTAIETIGTDVPLILTLATPAAAGIFTDKVLRVGKLQPHVNLVKHGKLYHLSVAVTVNVEQGVRFTPAETFLLMAALDQRPSHNDDYQYFCFMGEIKFAEDVYCHLRDEHQRSGKFIITLGADAPGNRPGAQLVSSDFTVECAEYTQLPISEAVERVSQAFGPSS